jgi:hypothetical protein
MTIHAKLETRAQTLTSLVVSFVAAAAAPLAGSSAVVFTAIEHLVSASDIVAVAFGGTAFASASAFDSSVVA